MSAVKASAVATDGRRERLMWNLRVGGGKPLRRGGRIADRAAPGGPAVGTGVRPFTIRTVPDPLAIAQVTPYPWEDRHEVNTYVDRVATGLAERGHRVLV